MKEALIRLDHCNLNSLPPCPPPPPPPPPPKKKKRKKEKRKTHCTEKTMQVSSFHSNVSLPSIRQTWSLHHIYQYKKNHCIWGVGTYPESGGRVLPLGAWNNDPITKHLVLVWWLKDIIQWNLVIMRSLGPWKLPCITVSHYIRVKKQRNIKSWDQQNYLVITGFCLYPTSL